MNVTLTPELESYIADQIKSGRYTSPSEVIGDALRRKIGAEALDRRLAAAMAEVEQGLGREATASYFDERKRRLQQKFAP
jgi:putative addiction module CopG family antidote